METAFVAELFRQNGLSCAELLFYQSDLAGWRYDFCGRAQLPSAQNVLTAVETYRRAGVTVSALGVYSNFWCGDDKARFDTLVTFSEYCDLAAACGVPLLATHGGTSATRSQSRRFDETDRRRFYDAAVFACIEAEKHGLTIALEPLEGSAVTSQADYDDLKAYVRSQLGRDGMLRCIYSPADGAALPRDAALFHIKDKKTDGIYYERFGDGDTDWRAFSRAASKHHDVPWILEYVNSGNLSATVERLRRFFDA